MNLLELFRAKRLNCKPGDLARIITPGPNQDRLVRVIELADRPLWWVVEPLQRIWCYKRQIEVPAGTIGNCSDAGLRPIRGLPGEDETLRWAGKPEPKTFAEAVRQAIGEVSSDLHR